MVLKKNICLFRLTVFVLLISIFLVPCLYGQTSADGIDDHIFKIAVIGPSDEVFIWWGHAALFVEHTRWKTSWTYDWGIFTYPSESFVKDFIKGQVQYSVESSSPDIQNYIKEDRDIIVYTLDLDKKAKEIMLSYAKNKVLPENRNYDYHEFLDNCSTGVRDILDLGLRGQFKAAFDNVPGRLTFRQHVKRFIWFRLFPEWLLDFLMGQDLDRQITPWEEMFLPVEIGRNIVDFKYIDEFGKERKLVSSVEIINSSKTRQPILNEPLDTKIFFFIAGLIIMAFVFFIRTLRKRYFRFYRILWGIIQSILGLFFGSAGCILFWGLFLMNNDYIQQNINIFFVNPLLLIIVPLGILTAINKSFRINPDRILRLLWTYVFAAGSVTEILKVLPFFYQQNQNVSGFVLPIAFAFSIIPENIYKLKPLFRKLRKRFSRGRR
ncbi:MAG: DUF4105 domain-containing protein [Treponema sp.]|jgi:hypothetical protein|nr:DUF4105 domain-containing protein [Treponema sp.]